VAQAFATAVEVDPMPHVREGEVGLRLAATDDGWRRRPGL
jgi:hypothetical protein